MLEICNLNCKLLFVLKTAKHTKILKKNEAKILVSVDGKNV